MSWTIPHAHAARPTLTVSFFIAGTSHSQAVMLESGADANFMDSELARSLRVQLTLLPAPLRTMYLDGSFLWEVTHKTCPLHMTLNKTDSEDVHFLIYTLALQLVVLVLPLVQLHNPAIDWVTGELQFHSDYCRSSCFTPVSALVRAAPADVDLPPPDLSNVPECYHDLREVFSNAKAMSLPLHRSYDCVVDLPSASPPKKRLYSLLPPETQAMRDYIQSSLRAGIIRPSSSPTLQGCCRGQNPQVLHRLLGTQRCYGEETLPSPPHLIGLRAPPIGKDFYQARSAQRLPPGKNKIGG